MIIKIASAIFLDCIFEGKCKAAFFNANKREFGENANA